MNAMAACCVLFCLKTAFNRTVKFSTKFQILFVDVYAVLSATITYAFPVCHDGRSFDLFSLGCSSAVDIR